MHPGGNHFYGVTTIGTRGQIVIPAEAREHMNMQPGDKVLVVGKQNKDKGFGMVCICPIASAERFVEELTNHVTATQAALKKAKEEDNGEEN